MCVCVYVCVCLCMSVYIYLYICISMYVFLCMCKVKGHCSVKLNGQVKVAQGARGLSEAGSNEDFHCSLFRYAKGTPISRTFNVGCGHLFFLRLQVSPDSASLAGSALRD